MYTTTDPHSTPNRSNRIKPGYYKFALLRHTQTLRSHPLQTSIARGAAQLEIGVSKCPPFDMHLIYADSVRWSRARELLIS